jgi:hypothetical protein
VPNGALYAFSGEVPCPSAAIHVAGATPAPVADVARRGAHPGTLPVAPPGPVDPVDSGQRADWTWVSH